MRRMHSNGVLNSPRHHLLIPYLRSFFPYPSFTIKGTHIVPRSYVTDRAPIVAEDIKQREDRSRATGGIGCAVILIQCGGISQVMPVEVDPPSKISWDMRDDWAEVLKHFVESGRTDFKPVSTTARGCVFRFPPPSVLTLLPIIQGFISGERSKHSPPLMSRR